MLAMYPRFPQQQNSDLPDSRPRFFQGCCLFSIPRFRDSVNAKKDRSPDPSLMIYLYSTDSLLYHTLFPAKGHPVLQYILITLLLQRFFTLSCRSPTPGLTERYNSRYPSPASMIFNPRKVQHCLYSYVQRSSGACSCSGFSQNGGDG